MYDSHSNMKEVESNIHELDSPPRFLKPQHSRSRRARRLGIWAGFFVCITIIIALLTRSPDAHAVYQKVAASAPWNEHDQAEPASSEPLRKALVLASYKKQNVDWVASVPSDWEVNRYLMDDPSPEDGDLAVPRNQGRESMAYMTYIVNNYDNFPDIAVFMQGHERAWHQTEHAAQLIRALNLTTVQEHQFMNLRCLSRPSCDGRTRQNLTMPVLAALSIAPQWWATVLGDPEQSTQNTSRSNRETQTTIDGLISWRDEIAAGLVSPGVYDTPPSKLSIYNSESYTALPPVLQFKCCGQFAISKQAVLQHPKSFWQSFYEPLTRDLKDYPPWGTKMEGYTLGLFFEATYHILFGNEKTKLSGTACPSTEYCEKVLFQDAIRCDNMVNNTGRYEESIGWPKVRCFSKFDKDIIGLEDGRGSGWNDTRQVDEEIELAAVFKALGKMQGTVKDPEDFQNLDAEAAAEVISDHPEFSQSQVLHDENEGDRHEYHPGELKWKVPHTHGGGDQQQ